MNGRSMRLPEAFKLLDEQKVGMVSFQNFAKNFDRIVVLSEGAK
jgi:hypothetical protein